MVSKHILVTVVDVLVPVVAWRGVVEVDGTSAAVVLTWVGTGPYVVELGKVVVICSSDTLAAVVVKLTPGCCVVRGRSVVKLLTVAFTLGLMFAVTVVLLVGPVVLAVVVQL